MENFIPWDIIKKYLQNNLSEKEEKELKFWIGLSELNKIIFEEILEDNDFKSLLLRDKWENHKYNWNKFKNKLKLPERKFVLSRKLAIGISSIAALILLFFGITNYKYSSYIKNLNSRNSYTYIYSPRGQRTSVILPDNSRVWLNSGSSIKYYASYNLKKREVYLEGEAFFDIKKSKKIFMVKTSDAIIKVYGTRFNVKAYPEDKYLETTLINGKISLIPINQKGEKQEIVLKPREKCIIERKNIIVSNVPKMDSIKNKMLSAKTIDDNKKIEEPTIKIQKNIDAEKEESWKDGRLVFRKERFEDLAVKLERWYDVKIHFLDDRIKNYVFTGTFDKETVDQAMEALRISSGKTYNYKMKYRDIYLYIDK